MSTLAPLAVVALLVWFWLDSLRAREIATGIGKAACRRHGVQFLDQTVALYRLGLRWGGEGLRLRRLYRFDYSEEGVGRSTGYIAMLGASLEGLHMGPNETPDAP